MTWSLGELEATARKAARGAGMSWGMAEEAGRATRWLCAAGLSGGESLSRLLTWADGRDWASLRPEAGNRDAWHARGGLLCPVATGTAYCDAANGWAVPLRLGPVAQPLLLAPFVAGAAATMRQPIRLQWEGVRMLFDEHGALRAMAGAGAVDADRARETWLQAGAKGPSGPCPAPSRRAHVPPETAETLLTFAQRIYAPETPERRRAGAGAGPADSV